MDIIDTVAVETLPLNIHCWYAAPSMNNLRLNCFISSLLLPTNIGIVAVAVVVPGVNVALYRPAVKSDPAVQIQKCSLLDNISIHKYNYNSGLWCTCMKQALIMLVPLKVNAFTGIQANKCKQ